MTVWLWLGLALLLAPGAREEGAADATGAADLPRTPVSLRTLQVVAALGVGAVLVLGLGGTVGALAAGPAAGATWTAVARLSGRPARIRPDPALPITLDLVAAAVRAGQPVPAAVLLAAPAAAERNAAALSRAARLLALGADPADAWAPLGDDAVLRDVAAAARRSATSGIRLAAAFEQTATDLRAAGRAVAQARAHRAGAFATVPLGLCFLPAFICLAIVPVVVGIASTALGSAR